MDQQARGGAPAWQIPDQDKPVRQQMISKIYALLRQRKPSADEEWLRKLPDMAKRLEDKLYRHARSMNEYQDESTLKTRLQQIASEMRQNPQQHAQAQQVSGHAQSSGPNPPITVSTHGVQPLPIHGQSGSRPNASPPSSQGAAGGHFQDYPQQSPPSGHQVHQQQPQGMYAQAQQQAAAPKTMYQTAASQPPPSSHLGSSNGQQQQHSGQQVQPSANGRSGGPSQREVLRQQQQRLLLLRHASKCPAKPGECTATSHCAQMKQLWKHIENCKDTECRVPHCVSSRFVLAHYHKCTDSHCEVCQPVRAAIAARSTERTGNGQQPSTSQQRPPMPGGGGHAPQRPQQNGGGNSMSPQVMHGGMPPQPQSRSGKSLGGIPMPQNSGGVPPGQGQLPVTSDPRLNDILMRYSVLWKQITTNADQAKLKQEELDRLKQDQVMKNQEKKHITENERQLESQSKARGTTDALIEAKLQVEKLKSESVDAALRALKVQGELLEAELRTMKMQHQRNIEAEREFHKELGGIIGDPERIKGLLQQARKHSQQQQQQQQQQHQASMAPGAGMPMNTQHQMIPPPSHARPMPQGPVPVAQIPAQAVVKGKAKKEPKDTAKEKKATKGGKKGVTEALSPPGPPMPPMPISGMVPPYPHQPPGSMQMLQRQGSGMQPGVPVSGNMMGGVPPPPPNKATGRVSQPPTPKQANGRAPQPGMAPSQMMAPHPQQQMVPMRPTGSIFREPPVVSRSILDASLINTFLRKDIESHIQFLGKQGKEIPANRGRDAFNQLLKKAIEEDKSGIFAEPVDPIRDEAPNYFDIIKKPMDFTTIRAKVDSGNQYQSLSQLADDIRLIYANCMRYNPPVSHYYQEALRCGKTFEKDYAMFMEAEEDKGLKDRLDVNKCRLCGGSVLLYEPVTYYCAGPCQRRIQRATVFSSSDNRHWCTNCFQHEVPETVVLADGTQINKRELTRGKVPDAAEEGWVGCCGCKRWFHQVCAMFNTKRGQDSKKDDFLCPFCVLVFLDQRKEDRIRINPEPKRATARDLPETEFSKFLEKAAIRRVAEARKKYCTKNGVNIKDVDDVNQLTVRVVMAKEAEVWTRSGIARVYPEFPKSFNSRQKAILMFEKLDGVDTLIYIMFLQHYGSDCSTPNDRCLYIAYLDSVFYLRPSFVRTEVYHELITSVLDYERKRGITRCFIWACPPTGGDDYIFHVHPKNQKTPKPDRLRLWYLSLLEDARQRGVVVSVSNLFDEYLSRVSDLVDVPYFEGDCWPTYAEHYITEMEQKGQDPKSRQPRNEAVRQAQVRNGNAAKEEASVRQGGPKRQNKRAKTAGGSGSKSMKGRSMSLVDPNNDDDDMETTPEIPLALMCPLPKPLDQVPSQSLITAKIAAENDRMKDDFIVVKMYYDCVECAAPMDYPGALYWLPKIYSPDKDPHDYKKRRYAPPYCLCHDCYLSAYQAEHGTRPEFSMPAFPPPEWAEEYKVWQAKRREQIQQQPPVTSVSAISAMTTASQGTDASSQSPGQSASQREDTPADNGTPAPIEGKDSKKDASKSTTKRKSAGANRKRKATGADVSDLDTIDSSVQVLEPGVNAKPPNPYGSTPPVPLNEMKLEVAMIRPVTVDLDPLMECSIFNVREDFLSLCQGNKYQFDELRRAKHSSMMILYHLHNPDSDAFVHNCNGCKNEIKSARWNCATCTDFDLCQECYEGGKVRHAHGLALVNNSSATLTEDGEPGATTDSSGQPKLTQTQYLQMLEHSAKCDNPNCEQPLCSRFKRLLEHAPTCTVRIAGGCSTCKRYWQFLAFHARQCRTPSNQCRVPYCDRIKSHIRAQANKVADRRMMALMQRSNQSPAPSADETARMNSGYTMDGQQMMPMGHTSGGAPPPQQHIPHPGPRSLTSPRGKGGKGMRSLG